MDYLRRAKEISCRARTNIIKVVYRAKGGHVGGSLSVVDILSAIYSVVDEYDVEVILSKGHCLLAWLCVLKEIGEVSEEDLQEYYSDGSKFAGHPKKGSSKSITWGTGSLGHGLAVCCGKAMARPKTSYFCILGDGECNEGSVWESLMFMAQHQLKNITVIIDNNRLESLDLTCNILNIENLEQRLNGLKLNTVRIDGHDMNLAIDLFRRRLVIEDKMQPLVIVADTLKGKGVSYMEGVPMWHHRKLNEAEFRMALKELKEEVRQ